jgi:hypothetical protein
MVNVFQGGIMSTILKIHKITSAFTSLLLATMPVATPTWLKLKIEQPVDDEIQADGP